MKPKQYFPREIHGAFNLRKPKGDKPTPIYFVVRVLGTQLKIPLGVKVYPSHWNKKRQEAFISPHLNESDNSNNKIVNTTIANTKIVFTHRMEEAYNIMCSDSDIGRILRTFKAMIKDALSKQGGIKNAKGQDIISVLYKAIDNDSVSEGSKRAYRDIVKRFADFCNAGGIALYDFNDLNKDIMDDYFDYLRNVTDCKRSVDGRLSAAHINKLIKGLLQRIHNYAVKGEMMEDSKFASLRHAAKRVKENVKEGDNCIALRDDEIYRLFKYKCQNPKDEDIKNMFCFACCTGQRVSDWNKVADSLKTEDGISSFRIKQKKCGKVVNVTLIFELAQEIVNLYDSKLPKVKASDVNARIKVIAKAANVACDEVETYRQSGMTQEISTKKVCRADLIVSHSARRSFITMLILRNKNPRYIMEHSGHQDLRMIDRYTKISPDEIRHFERLQAEGKTLKMIDYSRPSMKDRLIKQVKEGGFVGAVCLLIGLLGGLSCAFLH